MGKTRVNISVDSDNLKKARKKLDLFGGKLSTLFNSYLRDFVESSSKEFDENHKVTLEKIKDLEKRLDKLEKVNKN